MVLVSLQAALPFLCEASVPSFKVSGALRIRGLWASRVRIEGWHRSSSLRFTDLTPSNGSSGFDWPGSSTGYRSPRAAPPSREYMRDLIGDRTRIRHHIRGLDLIQMQLDLFCSDRSDILGKPTVRQRKDKLRV